MSEPYVQPHQQQPPPDRSVKVAHLVFGLLFLGVAGLWALVASDVISDDRLTVIAPALIIGAGVIGLVASLASSRNRRQARRDPVQEQAWDRYEPVADDLDQPAGRAEETDRTDEADEHTREIR